MENMFQLVLKLSVVAVCGVIILSMLQVSEVEATSPKKGSAEYIYWACKGNNKAYCRQFFHSMAVGFVSATMSYPVNDGGECGAAKDTVKARVQWFASVMQRNSLEDIVQRFVDDVENIVTRDIDYHEVLKETLFSFYTEEASKDQTQDAKKFNWVSSQKVVDLYLSCKRSLIEKDETIRKTDYCYSLISGVQFGLDLAAYKLKNYPEKSQCSKEKNDLLSLFTKRLFAADYRCHFTKRENPKTIAKAYVDAINKMKPEMIMGLVHERPEYKAMSTMQNICKKG